MEGISGQPARTYFCFFTFEEFLLGRWQFMIFRKKARLETRVSWEGGWKCA